MPAPPADVSAVLTTRNRRELCRRALASILDQDPCPMEVMVYDDGSTDGTREELEQLSARDKRVRYVYLDPPAGRPAPLRNLGLREARSRYVAFLDDDDAWFPGKLARQLSALDDGEADVVAGNARRSDGRLYFADGVPRKLDRVTLLRANPIVLSTALVRRQALLEAGGFPHEPWLRGVEDYAAWQRMADRGACFRVLDETLAEYDDSSQDRLSGPALRHEVALLRFAASRWRQTPGDVVLARATLHHAVGAISLLRHRAAAPAVRLRKRWGPTHA